MQEAPQEHAQEVRRDTRFRPGVSGNPGGAKTRRMNLQRKIAELAAPYGGIAALAADETELIKQAAALTMRRIADADQQVRVANALRSIFQLLSDRRRKSADDDNSMTLERYAALQAAANNVGR